MADDCLRRRGGPGSATSGAMPLSWDFSAYRFASLAVLIGVCRNRDGTEGSGLFWA